MKKNLIDRRALPIVLGITVVATAVAVASMAAVPARSHSQPGPPPDAVRPGTRMGSTPCARRHHEVPDGRNGLHGLRPGGRLRRRHEDRRQVRAVPRLRLHPGARRLRAGGGRGCGPHGPENYLPDQQPTVDAEYNAYLATLSGGVADGVAAGNAAANDLIAFRTGDGLKAPTPAYGQIGPIIPGKWQLQSPTQTAQTPWLATLRPFLLDGASQFRAAQPPAITSGQYAKDLNETETYGAVNSSARSKDQTDIAYFWNGNDVNQFNVTMQNVVAQHDMDIDEAAHLFGMGMIVTADAGIGCYDSKFFYEAWRPITAIRYAGIDGNPDTTADPNWSPLLTTPAHPEYPSQHGCFTAAFTDALAAALGTRHLDVTMPGGANGSTNLSVTQHFKTVNDIQKQEIDARVWIGFHFRNSVKQGERLGNGVADWELDRFFQPADS